MEMKPRPTKVLAGSLAQQEASAIACPQADPARLRAVSWAGTSPASSAGRFFPSADLDASTASTWMNARGIPTCNSEPLGAYPSEASLLPAGMLSPENVCPAVNGVLPAPRSLANSAASSPQARPALQPVSVDTPKHSMTSQHSTQLTDDIAAARLSRSPDAAAIDSQPQATTSSPSCASTQLPAALRHGSRNTSAVSSATVNAAATEWLAAAEIRSTIEEMLEEEKQTAVNPDYLAFHSDRVLPDGLWMSPTMRYMTVNWMSEAVHDLDLDQKVISMAVLLLDRYLSSARQFPRTMLQLAAATAIFLSAKIEGVLPHPRASRVAALSDGAFDLHHLVDFEHTICSSLGCDLYGPTTQNFLDLFLNALPQPASAAELYFFEKVHCLASYLLELASLVYATLARKRSVLATAALLLALADPGLQEAVADILHVSDDDMSAHAEHIVGSLRQYIGPGVSLAEVTVTASELLRFHKVAQIQENRDQFVVEKFSQPGYAHIAQVARPVDSQEDFHRILRIFYQA